MTSLLPTIYSAYTIMLRAQDGISDKISEALAGTEDYQQTEKMAAQHLVNNIKHLSKKNWRSFYWISFYSFHRLYDHKIYRLYTETLARMAKEESVFGIDKLYHSYLKDDERIPSKGSWPKWFGKIRFIPVWHKGREFVFPDRSSIFIEKENINDLTEELKKSWEEYVIKYYPESLEEHEKDGVCLSKYSNLCKPLAWLGNGYLICYIHELNKKAATCAHFEECSRYAHFIKKLEEERRESSANYDDGVNLEYYNDDLDMDQQSPDFWG